MDGKDKWRCLILKVCLNCGHKSSKPINFCSVCGFSIIDENLEIICEKCGAKNLLSRTFCSNCAANIEKGYKMNQARLESLTSRILDLSIKTNSIDKRLNLLIEAAKLGKLSTDRVDLYALGKRQGEEAQFPQTGSSKSTTNVTSSAIEDIKGEDPHHAETSQTAVPQEVKAEGTKAEDRGSIYQQTKSDAIPSYAKIGDNSTKSELTASEGNLKRPKESTIGETTPVSPSKIFEQKQKSEIQADLQTSSVGDVPLESKPSVETTERISAESRIITNPTLSINREVGGLKRIVPSFVKPKFDLKIPITPIKSGRTQRRFDLSSPKKLLSDFGQQIQVGIAVSLLLAGLIFSSFIISSDKFVQNTILYSTGLLTIIGGLLFAKLFWKDQDNLLGNTLISLGYFLALYSSFGTANQLNATILPILPTLLILFSALLLNSESLADISVLGTLFAGWIASQTFIELSWNFGSTWIIMTVLIATLFYLKDKMIQPSILAYFGGAIISLSLLSNTPATGMISLPILISTIPLALIILNQRLDLLPNMMRALYAILLGVPFVAFLIGAATGKLNLYDDVILFSIIAVLSILFANPNLLKKEENRLYSLLNLSLNKYSKIFVPFVSIIFLNHIIETVNQSSTQIARIDFIFFVITPIVLFFSLNLLFSVASTSEEVRTEVQLLNYIPILITESIFFSLSLGLSRFVGNQSLGYLATSFYLILVFVPLTIGILGGIFAKYLKVTDRIMFATQVMTMINTIWLNSYVLIGGDAVLASLAVFLTFLLALYLPGISDLYRKRIYAISLLGSSVLVLLGQLYHRFDQFENPGFIWYLKTNTFLKLETFGPLTVLASFGVIAGLSLFRLVRLVERGQISREAIINSSNPFLKLYYYFERFILNHLEQLFSAALNFSFIAILLTGGFNSQSTTSTVVAFITTLLTLSNGIIIYLSRGRSWLSYIFTGTAIVFSSMYIVNADSYLVIQGNIVLLFLLSFLIMNFESRRNIVQKAERALTREFILGSTLLSSVIVTGSAYLDPTLILVATLVVYSMILSLKYHNSFLSGLGLIVYSVLFTKVNTQFTTSLPYPQLFYVLASITLVLTFGIYLYSQIRGEGLNVTQYEFISRMTNQYPALDTKFFRSIRITFPLIGLLMFSYTPDLNVTFQAIWILILSITLIFSIESSDFDSRLVGPILILYSLFLYLTFQPTGLVNGLVSILGYLLLVGYLSLRNNSEENSTERDVVTLVNNVILSLTFIGAFQFLSAVPELRGLVLVVLATILGLHTKSIRLHSLPVALMFLFSYINPLYVLNTNILNFGYLMIQNKSYTLEAVRTLPILIYVSLVYLRSIRDSKYVSIPVSISVGILFVSGLFTVNGELGFVFLVSLYASLLILALQTEFIEEHILSSLIFILGVTFVGGSDILLGQFGADQILLSNRMIAATGLLLINLIIWKHAELKSLFEINLTKIPLSIVFAVLDGYILFLGSFSSWFSAVYVFTTIILLSVVDLRQNSRYIGIGSGLFGLIVLLSGMFIIPSDHIFKTLPGSLVGLITGISVLVLIFRSRFEELELSTSHFEIGGFISLISVLSLSAFFGSTLEFAILQLVSLFVLTYVNWAINKYEISMITSIGISLNVFIQLFVNPFAIISLSVFLINLVLFMLNQFTEINIKGNMIGIITGFSVVVGGILFGSQSGEQIIAQIPELVTYAGLFNYTWIILFWMWIVDLLIANFVGNLFDDNFLESIGNRLNIPIQEGLSRFTIVLSIIFLNYIPVFLFWRLNSLENTVFLLGNVIVFTLIFLSSLIKRKGEENVNLYIDMITITPALSGFIFSVFFMNIQQQIYSGNQIIQSIISLVLQYAYLGISSLAVLAVVFFFLRNRSEDFEHTSTNILLDIGTFISLASLFVPILTGNFQPLLAVTVLFWMLFITGSVQGGNNVKIKQVVQLFGSFVASYFFIYAFPVQYVTVNYSHGVSLFSIASLSLIANALVAYAYLLVVGENVKENINFTFLAYFRIVISFLAILLLNDFSTPFERFVSLSAYVLLSVTTMGYGVKYEISPMKMLGTAIIFAGLFIGGVFLLTSYSSGQPVDPLLAALTFIIGGLGFLYNVYLQDAAKKNKRNIFISMFIPKVSERSGQNEKTLNEETLPE